jgi:hypothetical protein
VSKLIGRHLKLTGTVANMQRDFARRLVDDADIPNSIFHTADFATIDLAHGIHSWVGAAVRDESTYIDSRREARSALRSQVVDVVLRYK